MRAHHVTTLAAVVAVLVLLGAGCTGKSSDSANSTNTASSSDSASLADSTPATEGSGPESPQPSKNGGPSLSVASLPIGGGVSEVGDLQCADVHMVGAGELPAQVVISLDEITLKPGGLFDLASGNCGANEPACSTSWTWTPDTLNNGCIVAAKQVVDANTVPADTFASLILVATIHCPDDSSCNQLRPLFTDGAGGPGSLGGSQISFTVQAPPASDSPSSK
jgi:hypothetical protein